MSLDFILLGLLREPKSGYELKAEFGAGVANFWAAELSQIYVTLKRMTREGLLTVRRAPSDKGPDKQVYARTRAGDRALHEWLTDEPRMGDERFAYLGQLYFLGELDDWQATESFLTGLLARFRARQAALRQVDQMWSKAAPGYPDGLPTEEFHAQMTLQLGLETAAARTAWCEAMLARVKARRRRRGKHARDI